MLITCCKDCVPPERHLGCHSDCPKYLEQKAEYESQKEYLKSKDISISKYDFDEIIYANCKRHKRRRKR